MRLRDYKQNIHEFIEGLIEKAVHGVVDVEELEDIQRYLWRDRLMDAIKAEQLADEQAYAFEKENCPREQYLRKHIPKKVEE